MVDERLGLMGSRTVSECTSSLEMVILVSQAYLKKTDEHQTTSVGISSACQWKTTSSWIK